MRFYSQAIRQVINWEAIQMGKPDAIFGIQNKFKEDKDPRKISLVIGAYRDELGKPYPFKVVQKAEEEIFKSKMDKEYLPITGDANFCKVSQKLAFGINSPNIATIQALSGTGALSLGAIFISRFLGKNTKIYLPDPTWPNHPNIFKDAGLVNIFSYPYYNAKSNNLSYDKMVDFIKKMESNTVILLHACAHNPTGVDLTKSNWKEIVDIILDKKILPFIDMAYQGFATGDIENDSYAVKLLWEKNLEFLVSQSFAKNMGLYNERIGAINIVGNSPESSEKVNSQLSLDIRTRYSNPPAHGARIVAKIL